MSTTGTVPGRLSYDERLRVPLWWWPASLALGVLLAAVVHSGADGPRAVVPYAVALPLVVVLLLRASRGRIRIEKGLLHVPGARLPVALVDRAVVLDATSLRRLAGPQRHPWAFVVRRGFLSRAVLLELDDPQDDTPYWVVSTRRPELLVAALSPRSTTDVSAAVHGEG